MRHLTMDDAPAVLALLIACDIAEYGEPDSDLESLLDDWRPLDLARDAWLIQDASGRVLGYMAVFARAPGYGVDMYVHPEHSEAGLQAVLLARCEEHARGSDCRQDQRAAPCHRAQRRPSGTRGSSLERL